jgi:hypothetical protein
MRRLIVTALLCLASLAAAASESLNEYGHPQGGEFPLGQRAMVVIFDIRTDVDAECQRMAGKLPQGYKFIGCADWFTLQGSCRVVLPPNASDALVRHEIAHCLKGFWHD